MINFIIHNCLKIRRLAKMYLPQPGEGPSDQLSYFGYVGCSNLPRYDREMKYGYLTGTNLTTSASRPPVQVKTVLKIKGDPGYQGSASKFFSRAGIQS